MSVLFILNCVKASVMALITLFLLAYIPFCCWALMTDRYRKQRDAKEWEVFKQRTHEMLKG